MSFTEIPGGAQAHHEKQRQRMMEGFQAQRAEILKTSTMKKDVTSSRFTSSEAHKSNSNGESAASKVNKNANSQSLHNAPSAGKPEVQIEEGLIDLENLKRKRLLAEEEQARQAANTHVIKQEPSKAKKVRKKYVLSFDHSDHSDDDSSPSTKLPTSALNDKTKSAPLTLLKNPDVDTSFLPDREREEAERLEKEQLRLEWIKKQAEMKEEDICIGYSYWDGEGHRAEVVCKKGDSIGTFLSKARSQWPQLANTSIDNLMFVKEDLIIPSYDFAMGKWRGKSGPLFNFEERKDIILSTILEGDQNAPGESHPVSRQIDREKLVSAKQKSLARVEMGDIRHQQGQVLESIGSLGGSSLGPVTSGGGILQLWVF